MSFVEEHSLLVYGLGAFAVCIILFFVIRLILLPIIKSHLEKGQGWIIIGFLLSSAVGFFMGKVLSMYICFLTFPVWLCSIAIYFISIVGSCILYWRVFMYRIKET